MIYKALYELRRQYGFNQTEVADLLGISLQAYNQMELGKRDTLTVSNLILICGHLGILPETVFIKARKLDGDYTR
jgi:transcriptional regulator with XRE-family HTH domain|tara:strand:+ start:594 stop:818 length:225 start_codon:yes stop_codon:yes gene_type:complete